MGNSIKNVSQGSTKISNKNEINITQMKATEFKTGSKNGKIDLTLPTNVDNVEVEKVNFVDDFLDFVGSSKLSKDTGLSCFTMNDFDFVEKSDIKDVEKRGPKGENILVTLKNGDSYFFVEDNGMMELYEVTDKNGSTMSFPDGFSKFSSMFRSYSLGGDASPIDSMNITDNYFYVDSLGTEYIFDTDTGKINSIDTGDKYFTAADINNYMEDFCNKLASYCNEGEDFAKYIMDRYNLTTDNLTYIKANRGQLILNFNGVSVSTITSGSITSYTISDSSGFDIIPVPEGENLTL
ncbi:MAG TPA: hypothetical protein IAB59_05820 [Candidatus Onthousia faecipullorum]|uniref:Uncharacterized protein n=1 Tax=Candidatus Onthousia faecipullorum TaxID=2840887 RepID=A0A9D1KBT7_9FIRM|nr:hypothetical protein [Candidatus Onthousia faecipullorum]